MPNAMLKMNWKSFRSGSGDQDRNRFKYSNFENDRLLRNAFAFLAGLGSIKKTSPRQGAIHDPSITAGSLTAAGSVGGEPKPPGPGRDLHLSDCRFQFGRLVGCG
jgi:hypothetical protein